jgi:hypothetical protein
LVEDRDQIQPDEDVEAHKYGKGKVKATDEGTESGSEDFELHRKRLGGTDEGDKPDDDVELHKFKKSTK